MRAVRSLVVAVLAFVVFAAPSVVLADGRVALVVGNSTYAHIGRLPNPDNDARDISAALRRLGFEVTTELDADRVELTEALRAFTRRSTGADVSLVFYAGHGIEMDGVNYLVPVDARLERDVDVRFETVTVDDLLVSTTGASLRLVLLDACRNNPLARSMQRTAATRTVSGGSFADLNEDLLGDETLVAYAAAAGTTAADGRGRNSPYTAALLSHLETPLEIGLLFRRVRAQVLAATNGAQRPHEYHSLVGEHYLTRTLATGASVTVSAAAPADPVPADPPRPGPLLAADVTELPFAALRARAEVGDAEAQTELGERYANGRGVVQDYAVAVSWFRKAADQGYAPGQFVLSLMYVRGLGVAQNDVEAVRWERRAAEQGHAQAQNNLGVSYRDGLGVAQDYGESARWFRRAAEQGHAGAQNSLGVIYDTGRGVEQDYGEAFRWYPPCGRARRRPRPEQPRRDVRKRSGRLSGRCGSRPLVSSCGRAGRRLRPEQPRRDVRDRPRRLSGRRGSRPLVSSCGRAGQRARAVQPRLDVRERPWRAAGSRGSRPLVSSRRRAGRRRRAASAGPSAMKRSGRHRRRRTSVLAGCV